MTEVGKSYFATSNVPRSFSPRTTGHQILRWYNSYYWEYTEGFRFEEYEDDIMYSNEIGRSITQNR